MDELESIVNIRNAKISIKENMTSLNVNDYEGNFGGEGEYTYKGLLDCLDSLLTDINTLIKVPKQFVKISDYDERTNILNSMNNVNNHLTDPDNLHHFIVELKQQVRPFHIHYTKERLIEFDAELSALTKLKTETTRQLTELNKNLETSKESKEKSDGIFNSLQEQQQQLSEKLPQLEQNINISSENSSNIEEIKNNAESHNQVIDNFAKKIAEREVQLENQNTKTTEYNKELVKFTEQRNELLKTAEDLIKKAKTGLGYTKAEGISSAFTAQLDDAKKQKGWWWLFAAGFFVAIGITLTIAFFLKNQGTDFGTTLSRLSLLALPLAGAWFCAGQYTKLKNIIEDYAYKKVLAQSIVGFSEQLRNKEGETDTSYQEYMKKMLNEIHQHPVPKHKREDIDNTLAEKMIKEIKKQVNKLKSD